MLKKIIVTICFLSSVLSSCFCQNDNLVLTIQNVVKNAGTVRISIQDKNNFLKEKHIATKVLPASEQSMTVKFSLPKGEYAVSVSQDYNQNSQIDRNMFGVPTEPYGFSNNARPKFRPPTFDEAKFYLSNETKSMAIQLKSW